jgi:hypothetical protein
LYCLLLGCWMLLVCCKGSLCLLQGIVWGVLGEVLSPCSQILTPVPFWFFCRADSAGLPRFGYGSQLFGWGSLPSYLGSIHCV